MTVTLYTFEDVHGTEDTYTTFDAMEAKEFARRYHMRVIANEYEYSDSEVAWDFTEATGGYDGDPADVYESDDRGMTTGAWRGDEFYPVEES